MLPAEVFLLLAILCSTSVTVVLKLFSGQRGNRYGLLLGNYLTCIVIALCSMPDVSEVFHPDVVTLFLGILSGALFVAGLVCMQTGIRVNGASLTAAFARLGLIVPLAFGILLYGERPGPHQLVGILLVFAAIMLIHQDSESGQAVRAGLLILVLVVCGTGDAMIKVYEHAKSADSGSLFFFFLFGSAACMTLVLLIIEYRRTGKRVCLPELASGIIVGIPNYFSSAMLLRALVKLPAFIAYPCYSTGTIVLVLLISRFLFHEKLTRRASLGLVVILAALVLLNI